MRLDELLPQERLRIPLEVSSVDEAVSELVESVGDGEVGEPLRVSAVTVLFGVVARDGEEAGVAMGVAASPLTGLEGDFDEGPRIVLVLRSTLSSDQERTALDRLASVFEDPDVEARLLGATGPEEVRAFSGLMDTELTDPLRVDDVLVPLSYRVFPDTPLSEVIDLMARRGLRALPVVGEDLQLLGIVTAREALRHALVQRARKRKEDEEEEDRPAATARDVMSRSVMCVSGDQDLLDAAQLMVNKDVGQLPVVREGEIVGVLTRDAVLTALFANR